MIDVHFNVINILHCLLETLTRRSQLTSLFVSLHSHVSKTQLQSTLQGQWPPQLGNAHDASQPTPSHERSPSDPETRVGLSDPPIEDRVKQVNDK